MAAAPHVNKLPPLSALKGFEAAARRQGLRRAAEELNLTHPAIPHQIQRLEESLGVKLFAREGRQIILTPAGERFYPFVGDAIATLISGAETVRRISRPACPSLHHRLHSLASTAPIAISFGPPRYRDSANDLQRAMT